MKIKRILPVFLVLPLLAGMAIIIFATMVVGGSIAEPVPAPSSEGKAVEYYSVFLELGTPWDLVMLIDLFQADKDGKLDIEDKNPLLTALNFCTIETVYYVWVEYSEEDEDGNSSTWGEWVYSRTEYAVGSDEIRYKLGLNQYAAASAVKPAMRYFDSSFSTGTRKRESLLHVVHQSEYRGIIQEFYGDIFTEEEIDDIIVIYESGYIHYLYSDSVGMYFFLYDPNEESPPPSGDFFSPIPGNWRAVVSMEFMGYVNHTGIDFAIPTGTPIFASQPGTVIRVRRSNTGYGNHIVLSHGGGVHTLYAHNSENLVREGQTVEQGETIALSGNTGNSTGPHLHFEIIINGIPRNPRDYL
jgi:murein DD-endopeptidase MepM/ murein hydrolase activator NlpD